MKENDQSITDVLYLLDYNMHLLLVKLQTSELWKMLNMMALYISYQPLVQNIVALATHKGTIWVGLD